MVNIAAVGYFGTVFVTAHERESFRRDRLTETYADLAIRLGLLAFFLYWSFVLIRPFLSVIVWSVVLCVALYPLFEWLSATLGGRRRLAAVLTTALSLLLILAPLVWLVLGVTESAGLIREKLEAATLVLPAPSESVKRWPFGAQIFQFWDLAATNIRDAFAKVVPHLRPVGAFVLNVAADAGVGALKLLAAVIIAGILFIPGPAMVKTLKSFALRVASSRGEQFVKLAGASIRSIAQGVLGISALQAFLAGIGLVIAGVPAASLITTLVLMFSIMQIGPTPVLIPIVIWGWMTMDTSVAIAFTAYMVFVGVIDNVLRPIIMRRGLSIPVPVIIVGLIGGTLSHGITGLFLGPIILGVVWELATAWIQEPELEKQPRTESRVQNARSSATQDP